MVWSAGCSNDTAFTTNITRAGCWCGCAGRWSCAGPCAFTGATLDAAAETFSSAGADEGVTVEDEKGDVEGDPSRPVERASAGTIGVAVGVSIVEIYAGAVGVEAGDEGAAKSPDTPVPTL